MTDSTGLDEASERWVQYTHLDKLYGYLPGMRDALPAVFGLTTLEYQTVLDRFASRADSAASDLLADPTFAARIDALPFQAGQTVLAIGDSITDDLQSWAEILRHVLRRRRPNLNITLVNEGLSAHTSTMVLRRFPATLAAHHPDWVLCALGGNDVTRIGPEPSRPLIAPPDTVANFRRMRALAPQRHWVWLTPVAVREDRVAANPAFRFGSSSWRNDDIRALAREMHRLEGPVVDLVATFGVPADPTLQGEDGVHPSIAGQMAITHSLVERLTKH